MISDRLRHVHSRAVEEEIAVRKCEVVVLYSLQFVPPGDSFQCTLLP
jgi:hypothetical protein